MDILFSRHAAGGLPKSAMAEVERRTQNFLGSSSSHRMLGLEEQYKNERARGSHPLLPSSRAQSPARPRSGPTPRSDRPASSFPQEQFLTVDAARRSTLPHALSITIPQPAGHHGRNRQGEREAREADEHTDSGTPTNSDPSQKQVKFLATGNRDAEEGEGEKKEQEEEGEEEEEGDIDDRSEQSSICQSPSWEGYGQRKKEKKREAERRKKEKERAEKEAKAARKRKTARLSKAPPPRLPEATDQGSRVSVLTAADRSMTDPVSVGRRGRQSAQSLHRPEEEASKMTAAAGDGQQSRPAHDAFPHPASKTSELRHRSPPGVRCNSFPLQAATSANHSQETLSGTQGAQGTRRNGYVLQQRAQAMQRAMAGFIDEQLFVKISQHYPPPSSSSGPPPRSRRSSLTQEAKSVAMKFVGMKPHSASAKSNPGEADSLSFKAIPYASNAEASVTTEILPPKSSGGASNSSSRQQHDREHPPNSRAAVPRGASNSVALERPSSSRSSTSPHDIPAAGSDIGGHDKTSRNPNDLCAAANAGSDGQPRPVEGSGHSVPLSPYQRFRALMHLRAEKRAAAAQAVAKAVSEPAASAPLGAAVPDGDGTKSAETKPSESSRASEGSSSSSASGDGLQRPSPMMTPDTSRPQSAKDVLVCTNGRAKESAEHVGSRDDEKTPRPSLKSSKPSTPLAGTSETRPSIQAERDDHWSTTALPNDTDCETQSFMTTVSNLDKSDGTELEPSTMDTPPRPARMQQPMMEALEQASKANNMAPDVEPTISPPPRSAKRMVSSTDGSSAASCISSEERREVDGTPRGRARASEEERDTRRRSAAERHQQDVPPRRKGPRAPEAVADLSRQMDEDEGRFARGHARRAAGVPGSISSTSSAAGSAGTVSPDAPTPDYRPLSNPYFADFSEAVKAHPILGDVSAPMAPPSPISLPSPLHQVPSRPPAQSRADSAPGTRAASNSTSRASTPSSRPSGGAPTTAAAAASVPKRPKSSSSSAASDRPAALSALPKHMQLQAGGAPIAKIFVECCSCKFFHDLPSKVYECMAKPDAVVEDRVLGISGAITTMVKCPWCQHNMSRTCCAGYATVVYLKERLH
ncbi:hypothetical protein VTH06DRAFT_8134 [Thermothelomyces fergusii]